MTEASRALYVDADACPVKTEAKRVALRHRWPVFIVCNGGIRPDPDPNVQTIFVGDALDAADDWIAERIGPDDVCVTSDIPLAARCVAAGGVVVKPDGTRLDARNVGNALAMRDLATEMRSADPFATGSNPAFSKADRARFLDMLDRALRA